jgi:hypothetical protein
LRDLVLDPGLLHGMERGGRPETFDRDYLGALQRGGGHLAGAGGEPVEMHGACPALGDTAAVFHTGDAQFVAQYPQKRHVVLDIHLPFDAVHGEPHPTLRCLHLYKKGLFVH